MLFIVLLKKIICYVMISGGKASLPKMQNWDHSATLHALDDYMHSVCSFLFKIFFLFRSVSAFSFLFFLVLMIYNRDPIIHSNQTFTFLRGNGIIIIEKLSHLAYMRLGNLSRILILTQYYYFTWAMVHSNQTFFLKKKKKINFHFHPFIYSY